jgi:amidophosphoribosyltransferase
MSEQFGMVLESRANERENLSYIRWLFTYLLLAGEDGGQRATGVAWLDRDRNHYILERVGRAPDMMHDPAYSGFISGAGSGLTWLGGHTHPIRKDRLTIDDSGYPMRAGQTIGTHEGRIANASTVCQGPRLEDADLACCEMILRLADATLAEGRIDVPALAEQLSLCRGRVSAVIASKLDPETVVVVKGEPSLALRYYERLGAVIYARDGALLDTVLASDAGWREISADAMSILTLRCSDPANPSIHPFALA